MPTIKVTGLDELIARMERAGKLGDVETVDAMLIAGANEVKNVMKDVAKEHGFHDSGEMIEKIGFSKRPVSVEESRRISIYPQGRDSKTGVRNAAKAFYLHYGTSKIPASHWITEVNERAQEPALTAMTEVFNNRLNHT